MACDYNDELYKKYEYYNATKKSNIVELLRTSFNKEDLSVKQSVRYFNYIKFEGFYLIRFHSEFLKELKETMLFYGKNRIQLKDHLFILYYHLYIGYQKHLYNEVKEIIDEYCSVYDDFQKIHFIERLPELIMYRDIFSEKQITDIKLSETEYKICEKFLLKQLNPSINNIVKIEHYPKRGFIIKEYGGKEIWL